MKGEHCYLWSTDKKSWTAAENFCLKERGHLASATSKDTSVFLWKGMKRKGIRNVWIGGNDIEKEGTWKWPKACYPWKATFWASGEPNNWGNEDCMEMSIGNKGRWNDNSCRRKDKFICSQRICSGLNPNIRHIFVPVEMNTLVAQWCCKRKEWSRNSFYQHLFSSDMKFPYLIFVKDAKDGVRVNFFARCEFFQIGRKKIVTVLCSNLTYSV